jgi:hypothetical protein
MGGPWWGGKPGILQRMVVGLWWVVVGLGRVGRRWMTSPSAVEKRLQLSLE